MADQDWLNGFILGQHARAGAASVWEDVAIQRAEQINQLNARIRDLQDKLAHKSAVAEANKMTGRLVLDELRKLAPDSPLTDSERIIEIGQQFYKQAWDNLQRPR